MTTRPTPKFPSNVGHATIRVTEVDSRKGIVEIEFLTVQQDGHKALIGLNPPLDYQGAIFPESVVRAGILEEDRHPLIFDAKNPNSKEKIYLRDEAEYGCLISWNSEDPNSGVLFLATVPIKEYKSALTEWEMAVKRKKDEPEQRIPALASVKKQKVSIPGDKTPVPEGIFMVKHQDNWAFRGTLDDILTKATKAWKENPVPSLTEEWCEWFKKEPELGYVKMDTRPHLPEPNSMLVEMLKKKKVA